MGGLFSSPACKDVFERLARSDAPSGTHPRLGRVFPVAVSTGFGTAVAYPTTFSWRFLVRIDYPSREYVLMTRNQIRPLRNYVAGVGQDDHGAMYVIWSDQPLSAHVSPRLHAGKRFQQLGKTKLLETTWLRPSTMGVLTRCFFRVRYEGDPEAMEAEENGCFLLDTYGISSSSSYTSSDALVRHNRYPIVLGATHSGSMAASSSSSQSTPSMHPAEKLPAMPVQKSSKKQDPEATVTQTGSNSSSSSGYSDYSNTTEQ